MNKKITWAARIFGFAIATAFCLMIGLLLLGASMPKAQEFSPEFKQTTSATEPIIVLQTVHESWTVDTEAAQLLARVAWGEARGCTTTQQAEVMWCILNRVDSESTWFPCTVREVVTQPNQFCYSEDFPVTQELFNLAQDVLARWYTEPMMTGSSGRVLPREYCWFAGDGKQNWFRDAYVGGSVWDHSLDSPYQDCVG